MIDPVKISIFKSLMRRSFRVIGLWCCIILCKLTAMGQIEGNIAEVSVLNKNSPFTVTSYSTKDGLPQNQVLKILRKKSGELILLTANGIVEFNGYRFRPVTTDKQYKRQYFKSLHYFEKNDLLLGYDWYDKLYLISPVYKEFSIEGCHPMACVSNHDSLMVIGRSGNVYLYDPVQQTNKLLFKNPGAPIKLPDNFETSAIHNGQKIYLNNKTGIFCIDLALQQIRQISTLECHVLKQNPYNGLVYAVLQQSVAVIRNDRLDNLQAIQTDVPHGRTADMLFIDSSSFYLATDNGLIHTAKHKTLHYTKADGLPSTGLHALFYDSLNHCIFAGSSEKGLLKLLFKNNYSIQLPDNRYRKSVNSVILTSENQVLAVAGPSFYRIGEHVEELFSRGTGAHASLAEIDGNLYIGTWGEGVMVYKNNRPFDTIAWPKHLPHNVVHACFKDTKGMIWIGTELGIARGKRKQDITPFLTKRIHESVICFYELRNGNLCVGTSGGAYILKNDSIVARLDTSNGYSGKAVRAFHEDAGGKVWIGTYGAGLFCYDQNRFTSINRMKNCMLYEDAFCIAKDRYGFFYMTSNRGLWRVSEHDLNDFYQKKLAYLIPFHYTEPSGFLNTEFNGGFQHNFVKANGCFIFPTIEGLVKTVPEKPAYVPIVPTISNLRINDTLADKAQNCFERSTYSVQFDFECLNFISKNNVYFQHKLIGETNYEWSTPQKQTSVYLKMLPPGKYTFQVRAIDGFNDRNPRIASYSFEIRPYIHETLWFKILAAVVLATLMSTVAMMRIRSNRKKIEQKEYYKRKISEVELNAIQAQLNPHFIFNCMNTIKYFILEKDFANANEGLNKLSRLIRNSMENSEKLFIPIKQEMTFMTNYIELEKMRLREQLEYTINLAPDIDPGTLIPHLFIQPYIENAIKHGIANLENKQGILRIEISQDARNIICTVEDNGIGRAASGKLSDGLVHISKGTRLTLEKSQLLKQYYNYHCSISITDLYTNTQESSGTRVTISMSKKYYSGN